MKVRNVLAAVAAVLVALPAAAQTVTLRYNWTQGDVLFYRTTVKTHSTITGGRGGGGSFEQTLGQRLKVLVSAVAPDGTATLRQSIESVSVDMADPRGHSVYDSTKPPRGDADPRLLSLAKTYGGMVGEAISVTMASNGVIKRIDGNARIVDKLMADLPNDPMAGGLAQGIKAMLSEDALRTSLEQSFSRMPDVPVKIGDAWKAQYSMGVDAVGKIVGTSTFTLRAIEGAGDAAVARIGIALSLTQQSVPAANASTAVKLGDSRGEGEVLFSVAKGAVQHNSMNTSMASTLTMRGPDGNAETMQNNTKTMMTMELVKQEE